MKLHSLPNGTFLLGVTGSMGVGKTTFCERLVAAAEERGISVLHCNYDHIRAWLLETPHNPRAALVQDSLTDLFGDEIRSSRGGINRRRLADIIYWDDEAMSAHNQVVEPVVLELVHRQLHRGYTLALFDWALLAEREAAHLTNYQVLLVSCSLKEQLHRLSGGDLGSTHCAQRISLQASTAEKRQRILRSLQKAPNGQLLEVNSEAEQSAHYNFTLREIINQISQRKAA